MRAFSIILAMYLTGTVSAQNAAQNEKKSPPKQEQPIRPGWRLVDGGWVKPQVKVSIRELVKVVDEQGVHHIIAQPAARIEPMLRNWRISVIEIDKSDYAWKLSCVGRGWDERRAQGTQHLQIIAATDDAMADASVRLTKIDITPQRATVQAAVVDPDAGPKSILIVMMPDHIELAIAPLGKPDTDRIFRANNARELLRNHPDEARAFLVPVMQQLAGDQSVMQPAAGDVYRVFSDLPPDPLIVETIQRLLPDLGNRDPDIRARGSRELASLGRRGVHAAMKLDTSQLSLEAHDRIANFIRQNQPDPRTPAQLLTDESFLIDCLGDPNPQVRAAALAGLAKLNTKPNPPVP